MNSQAPKVETRESYERLAQKDYNYFQYSLANTRRSRERPDSPDAADHRALHREGETVAYSDVLRVPRHKHPGQSRNPALGKRKRDIEPALCACGRKSHLAIFFFLGGPVFG